MERSTLNLLTLLSKDHETSGGFPASSSNTQQRTAMLHVGWVIAIPLLFTLVVSACTIFLMTHDIVTSLTQDTVNETVELKDQVFATLSKLQNSLDNEQFFLCDTESLRAMRHAQFDLPSIKDLGGVIGYRLVCTTTLGLLPGNTLSQDAQHKIFTADGHDSGISFQRPKFLAVDNSSGTILLVGNFNAVLNERLDPSRNAGNLTVYGHVKDGYLPIFGNGKAFRFTQSPPNPTGTEITSKGITGWACSKDGAYCAEAFKSFEQVLSENRWLLLAISLAGLLVAEMAIVIVMQRKKIRSSTLNRLRRAIDDRSLFCVYQPIIDIGTGALSGAEVLVRWKNEDGEMVSPEEFCSIAEQNGLSHKLTQCVLECVDRDLGGTDGLMKGLKLSFNLAPSQLIDERTVELVRKYVERPNFCDIQVHMELTERVPLDIKNAAPIINQLRQLGVKTVIDDFGVGYSNLSQLKELHFSTVKVDRSFIEGVITSKLKSELLASVISMLRTIEVSIVIEGIETQEQIEWLSPYLPLLGQGYLFSRPANIQDLTKYIIANRENRSKTHS